MRQEIGRTFCKNHLVFLCFVSVLSFIVSKTDSDDINDQPCAMVAMIVAWCNSKSIKRRFYGHQRTIGESLPFLPSFRFKNPSEKQSTKELNYKRFFVPFFKL